MSNPELSTNNNESQPEFPLLEGKAPERLQSIARAIGRTTPTGGRTESGGIETHEGLVIRQMMERNELKSKEGDLNG